MVDPSKRVGLLDLDLYGPSIPTMMGVQKEAQLTARKYVPTQRLP
jgi:Mrp family chromosome partitioning ATPase